MREEDDPAEKHVHAGCEENGGDEDGEGLDEEGGLGGGVVVAVGAGAVAGGFDCWGVSVRLREGNMGERKGKGTYAGSRG